MWAYNMKLNLAKYTFGISVGKFLGFMVTQRGFEVNPTQIEAVLETPSQATKGVATPHRSSSSFGVFHSQFHGQAETFLPHA
ncbi:hypothetical protein CK203_065897 [Vitis vinifera]|uniref:Uncharacterized protein n=1 Tax=Vitis vinifera TaxID=29760 RepID=A0A438G3W4_VITVI|nr:hypothetical protein CK203_065897 [Vitis vinifera]